MQLYVETTSILIELWPRCKWCAGDEWDFGRSVCMNSYENMRRL